MDNFLIIYSIFIVLHVVFAAVVHSICKMYLILITQGILPLFWVANTITHSTCYCGLPVAWIPAG